MSSSRDKTKIQKEILDPVLNFFEKEREDAAREKQRDDARKRPYSREAQRKPEGKYEPSTNFYNVFSKLVGEQLPAQKIDQQSKEDETEQVTRRRDPEKKPDVSQELEKTKKDEEKKTDSSAPPSIFERLSPRTKDEDETEQVLWEHDKKPDLSPEKQKTGIQEERLEKTDSPLQSSLFEMFSRRGKEGDETEQITQDLDKTPDVSQELEKPVKQVEKLETDSSAPPSVFELLSRRKKEKDLL